MIPWYRRLTWWLQRTRREETLRQELEFHLGEEADERQADGLGAMDAARAARRDLGNVTHVREDARALWSWRVLDELAQDLRFALRTMRRTPGVTAIAALTLALGIGANTAIYSFMDAILLRALPVPQPESLLVVKWQARKVDPGGRAPNAESGFVLRTIDGQVYDEGTGIASRIFPYPAYERLREAAEPLMASFFAYWPTGRLNIVARGTAEVVEGEYVSGGYFDGLRVAPAAGRPIGPADDRAGAPRVAVLSAGSARRWFGEAASAIGQPIRVNNETFTVIGVAPPEFFGVDPSTAPDVYLPLHAGRVSPDPNHYWLEMMGRLRPGVDAARAQAALGPVFERWVETTAATARERLNLPRLRLDPGAGGLDTLRRRYSQPIYVLLAMVGLILAIACVNTANLLLARAAARQREIAVRLGVGAGRARIARQLLTESVCLAGLSGALSVPVAVASMRLLTLLLANGQESFTLHAELNWRVLAVTFGLSLVSGLAFGLAPALQSTRPSLAPALKDSGAATGMRTRRGITRPTLTQLLVVAQIAISVLLLVGAGLFVRTLANLKSIDLGFNADRLLLFDVNARQAGHQPAEIASFYDNLRRQLKGVPGVTGVTMSHASLIRAGRSLPLFVDGNPTTGARVLNVGPDFFPTMGISLLQGRTIDERDTMGPRPVAVVSDRFARRFFGGAAAVGRHVTLEYPPQFRPLMTDGARNPGPVRIEVVGVAAAAQYGDLRDDAPPVIYLSYTRLPFPPIAQMTYALRTTTDPLGSAAAVRGVVREADPTMPLTNIRTQTVEIDATINQEIVFARLCSAFAGLALLIACVGLYGTLAYAVTRRTGEIGIRIALGARSGGVAWLVLREVCALAAISLAISLPIALAASQLVRVYLFNVEPGDPLTLATVVAILVGSAMAAAYGPARRAARISPMRALRAD